MDSIDYFFISILSLAGLFILGILLLNRFPKLKYVLYFIGTLLASVNLDLIKICIKNESFGNNLHIVDFISFNSLLTILIVSLIFNIISK